MRLCRLCLYLALSPLSQSLESQWYEDVRYMPWYFMGFENLSVFGLVCYWPLNSARLCHIGWSHCIQLSTRQVTIPFFFWIWKVWTGFCFIFISLENDFFELNVSPPSICWAFNELPHGTHLQPVWVTHAGAIQVRRWMTSVIYPPRAGWTGKSTIRGQKLRILDGLFITSVLRAYRYALECLVSFWLHILKSCVTSYA